MIPPVLVYLRVVRPGARRWRLVVPVVLLWPVLLPLGVLAEAAAFAVAAVMLPFGYARARKVALALPYLNRAICALRGLTLEVVAPGREVRMWIR